MDLGSIQTPLAGFAAGLVTSIHCIGMCGPLACAILPRGNAQSDSKNSRQLAIAAYHGSRLLSYTLIGVIAGIAGSAISGFFSLGIARYFPWVFAAVFLIFLFGWEKRLPKIPFLSKLFFRLRLQSGNKSGIALGATLGGFTPLLPCAPLYLLFGAAIFSGSALGGGMLLAAFALGTMAPMWLLQSQFFRLQKRFSPVALNRLQKSLALISVLLVLWRFQSGGEISPETGLPAPDCCTLPAAISAHETAPHSHPPGPAS